jgi:hypothetical protein
MNKWILQKYWYVPADRNCTHTVAFGAKFPESKVPSGAPGDPLVTVWVVESLLVHLTISFGEIVMLPGRKVKFDIVTVGTVVVGQVTIFALADETVLMRVLGVLPHAYNVTTAAMNATKVTTCRALAFIIFLFLIFIPLNAGRYLLGRKVRERIPLSHAYLLTSGPSCRPYGAVTLPTIPSVKWNLQ